MAEMVTYQHSYGKAYIPVYRFRARPLTGLPPIPESSFTGRSNMAFFHEVDLDVFGERFLCSYTDGDNRDVIATDSMKNFILRHALDFDGATQEAFLFFLGSTFLKNYQHVEHVRLTAREIPFVPLTVPQHGQFVPSTMAFAAAPGAYATATLTLARDGSHTLVTEHQCGYVNQLLMKLSGSAFAGFIRDDYTTLPETRDRPLSIKLDVFWQYQTADDLLAPDHARYVAAEQVRDLTRAVFASYTSESIQQLIHEMGMRILERFPQLRNVHLVAENRTRQIIAESTTDPMVKVCSDPFPAYGVIRLTVQRAM